MEVMSAASAPFFERTNTCRTDTLRPNIQTSPTFKPSLPITIPRRKSVRPPPRSPIRHQASPDFVFNFDFSVSPCSLHGRQQMVMNYATQPLLQQRGHASVLIPHGRQNYARCSVDIDADLGLEKRPYSNEPFLYSVPKIFLCHHGAHMRTQSPPQPCSTSTARQSDDRQKVGGRQVAHPVGETHVPANPLVSPISSSLSSSMKQSLSLSRGQDNLVACGFADGKSYGEVSDDGRLISAFQRRVASDSTSASDAPSVSTPFASPASSPPSPVSPAVLAPPSPVSPPPRHSRWRPTVPTTFRRSQMRAPIARTAAAPVVSFKVAQAERCLRLKSAFSPPYGEAERRSRSPFPGLGLRSRRGSSVASERGIRTVVGIGRNLNVTDDERERRVSVVLSNEDLERSLEKILEQEVSADEKDWEIERGRTRGRTLTRGKVALRD